MKIENVSAIVTGGGTGMGAATARLLAARGARVTLVGRRVEPHRGLARDLGGVAVQADISDPNAVTHIFNVARATHGTPGILINAAGDGAALPLVMPNGEPSDPALARKLIMLNLFGPLLMAQAFAAGIARAPDNGEETRGVIVNASSISATDGIPGAPYGAAKAGIDALALTLAREFAPWRIRVVTIAPGGVDTEMMRANSGPETYAFMERVYVQPRRLGRPDEFASLAREIIENEFLNGCVYRFDGGVRAPHTAMGPRDPTKLAAG